MVVYTILVQDSLFSVKFSKKLHNEVYFGSVERGAFKNLIDPEFLNLEIKYCPCSEIALGTR